MIKAHHLGKISDGELFIFVIIHIKIILELVLGFSLLKNLRFISEEVYFSFNCDNDTTCMVIL